MRTLLTAFLLLALAGCGRDVPSVPSRAATATPASTRPAPAPAPAPVPRADGGMPRRGPGDLYNACERIWCTTHEANYALDHFLKRHDGWVLHAGGQGDVFIPRGYDRGPGYPNSGEAVLRLCGAHVHPWLLGRGSSAVKKTGYNASLGYSRAHFGRFGTRLAPCCLNGLGWSYVHSAAPRQFRFADVDLYREVTGMGWQAPFPARASARP